MADRFVDEGDGLELWAADGAPVEVSGDGSGHTLPPFPHRGADTVDDEAPLAAAANINSTTGQVHTGSMIALLPSVADVEALALEGGMQGGEDPDALHLTLWFLGDAAEIPVVAQAALREAVTQVARQLPAGRVEPGAFGVALWNPAGDSPCLVYNVGGEGLADVRDHFGEAIGMALPTEEGWSMPDQHQPWAPHLCAAYIDPEFFDEQHVVLLEAALDRLRSGVAGPITFDRVRLTFGPQVIDIALTGGDDAGQAQVTAAASAAVDEEEDRAMPWKVQSGGEDCPFEVVQSDTGERVSCHDTQEEADEHVAALYANEPEAAAADDKAPKGKGGKCPPGFRPAPNGEGGCVPSDAPPAAAVEVAEPVPEAEPVNLEPLPGEHFHAIMHTEGVSTGKRTFLDLTWREPPFTYHWQKSSSAHGGMPEVVPVGLVTRVVRDGAALHAYGPIDLDSADGREHARRLVAGFDRWVSIGLDEQPTKVDMVWPDEDPEADPRSKLFAEPDQVIFNGGRVGELTAVSVPAQDDAYVEPSPELAQLIEVAPAEPAGTATVASAAPGDCAACDDELVTEEDMTAVEFADQVQAITAAACTITIPELPPRWWFNEPEDVDIDSAFVITEEGRIYAAIAPLGVNHRAFARAGHRKEVPFGNVDYSRFMGAWALTSSGRVHAGPVTMDCGHASRFRTNHEVAPAHYENSCTVVAKVRVGENREKGYVWAAGALEPGVSPDQLSRMFACRLSGDWQPHADKQGWNEFVAALLVPSPGFPMAHQGAATSVDAEGVLVASSVPVQVGPTSTRPALRVRVAGRSVARVEV
jgi:hypothetical protein